MAQTAMSYLVEERPIALFDSHPDATLSFVQHAWDRFRRHLTTAWTGVPDLDVSHGELRLFWVTVRIPPPTNQGLHLRNSLDLFTNSVCGKQTDGKEGKRDYSLREYEDVRRGFEKLCTLADVTRAMVLGYADENPFSMFGKSKFEEMEEEKRRVLRENQYRDFIPKRLKPKSIANQIDDILDAEEKEEEERRKEIKFSDDSIGKEEV